MCFYPPLPPLFSFLFLFSVCLDPLLACYPAVARLLAVVRLFAKSRPEETTILGFTFQ